MIRFQTRDKRWTQVYLNSICNDKIPDSTRMTKDGGDDGMPELDDISKIGKRVRTRTSQKTISQDHQDTRPSHKTISPDHQDSRQDHLRCWLHYMSDTLHFTSRKNKQTKGNRKVRFRQCNVSDIGYTCTFTLILAITLRPGCIMIYL